MQIDDLIDFYQIQNENLKNEFKKAFIVKQYKKNDVLYTQGDPIINLNIILSGMTKCSVFSEDGKEIIKYFGRRFGDILVPIDYNFRADFISSTTVTFLKKTIVAEMDMKTVYRLLNEYRELADILEKVRLFYIKDYSKEIDELKAYNGYDRFYYLCKNNSVLVKQLTHSDLGAYLGVDSRSITDYVKKLREQDYQLYEQIKKR